MPENKQQKYNSPAQATLTGIFDLFRKRRNDVVLRPEDRLDGKKVLISGASSGLGFATAMELAARGATVIMACRSGIPEKGEAIRKTTGSDKVIMLPVNLSETGSIGDLVDRVKNEIGPVDIVICNAAIVPKESRKTSTGLEEMFMVNYFAKFLMINALLKEGLIRSTQGIPRIIFVSSESHRNPRAIAWEQFGVYQSFKMNRTVEYYGYYKLLLTTFACELSRRLNPDGQINCSVFALCPGPVNTSIAREAPGVFQPLLKVVFRLFFRSPAKACEPVIYLASSPEVEGKALDYLFLMNRKQMDPKATDPANGKMLWERSEALKSRMALP
jgi:NAD(P)-dependent dehydrogenase (short-subunit alcohol dehydrogenase family)